MRLEDIIKLVHVRYDKRSIFYDPEKMTAYKFVEFSPEELVRIQKETNLPMAGKNA